MVVPYANSLFFQFFFVSLPQNHLIVMDYDILQSVSQGSDGAQDAENSRVKAIADELSRRCQLYEAQSGDGQTHVNPFEIEQRITESFAKEHGLWLPIDSVFDLGTPGPSGNENDTYVSNDIIYKVNNLLMPILKQDLVKNANPTPQVSIDTYMAALGFNREDAVGHYSNGVFIVWDLIPRNVLVDPDGDIFVVDAEIKRI